jgi:hypothetical protein
VKRPNQTDLVQAVKKLRSLPGVNVDVGFRQGRDAVLRQLESRTERDESALVDVDIQNMKDTISSLMQRCMPLTLPADYIFFLSTYGGLAIEDEFYFFSIYGTGPMVEDWYSSVDSDEVLQSPGDIGFLKLGSLHFRRQHRQKNDAVEFYLDISGAIKMNAIVGVGPLGGMKRWERVRLLFSPVKYRSKRKILANSFTQWLDLCAETRGGFIYLNQGVD